MNPRTTKARRPEPPGTNGIAVLAPACPAGAGVDLHRACGRALKTAGRPEPLTVLINDSQRRTNSRAVLDCLARHVDPAKLRLLVAAGTHSFSAAEKQRFAEKLLRGLPFGQLAWHDARSNQLAGVGIGRSWRAHRWLLEPGALLAIGSVEPHYFAGFTGAHKTATIGCAAYKDVQANHAAAMTADLRPGRLEDNAVHQGVVGMLTALEAIRPVAAINLLQVGDRIVDTSAGTPLRALNDLAAGAERAFIRHIDPPADAVIAEVTGPLGRSFYQADKGIKNNEWAVRNGGTIVLVAECTDGIGLGRFVKLLRQATSYEQAVSVVRRRGYRLGDHKAVRLRYLTDPAHRGVQLFVVSAGLRDQDARVLGLAKADSVGRALSAAGIDLRRDRVYRLRDAGNLCVLAEADA